MKILLCIEFIIVQTIRANYNVFCDSLSDTGILKRILIWKIPTVSEVDDGVI